MLSFTDESTPCIVLICRREHTKDQIFRDVQLCEKVRCRRVVYHKGLKEDLNKSEDVKPQILLERLPSDQGVDHTVEHKANGHKGITTLGLKVEQSTNKRQQGVRVGRILKWTLGNTPWLKSLCVLVAEDKFPPQFELDNKLTCTTK